MCRRRSEGGLSPRVRGNPSPPAAHYNPSRSIPACAGEPERNLPTGRRSPVYPRVCGGTALPATDSHNRSGLSPRVRGNPVSGPHCRAAQRSIPACAGEPVGVGGFDGNVQVYPRVCGGTFPGAEYQRIAAGLSPRVRGNPGQHLAAHVRARSIPACAGEPPIRPPPPPAPAVYPRVCGGTQVTCSVHQRH